MTASSGAASPSALPALPRVTHLVLFWRARTLGLVQCRIEHGTIASQSHADNGNVVVSITVSGRFGRCA